MDFPKQFVFRATQTGGRVTIEILTLGFEDEKVTGSLECSADLWDAMKTAISRGEGAAIGIQE